jgi:hypothetical protein
MSMEVFPFDQPNERFDGSVPSIYSHSIPYDRRAGCEATGTWLIANIELADHTLHTCHKTGFGSTDSLSQTVEM